MIKWNEYTWYSRLAAVIFFLGIFPAWTFYLGTQFAEVNNSTMEDLSMSDISTPVRHVPVQPIGETSSSTAQIGNSTVIVTCNNLNPKGIQVVRGGLTIQTLPIDAATSGVKACPRAEEHDVNFDGYPDFIVLDGTGSGGGSYSYWLFSSSTQQFYCPETKYCGFMNPEFHPETKTIVSRYQSGASLVIVDTYGVKDGKIVLLKEERIGN